MNLFSLCQNQRGVAHYGMMAAMAVFAIVGYAVYDSALDKKKAADQKVAAFKKTPLSFEALFPKTEKAQSRAPSSRQVSRPKDMRIEGAPSLDILADRAYPDYQKYLENYSSAQPGFSVKRQLR